MNFTDPTQTNAIKLPIQIDPSILILMEIKHQFVVTIDKSISQILNNVRTKFKLFFVFIRADIEC